MAGGGEDIEVVEHKTLGRWWCPSSVKEGWERERLKIDSCQDVNG